MWRLETDVSDASREVEPGNQKRNVKASSGFKAWNLVCKECLSDIFIGEGLLFDHGINQWP